MGREAVVRTVEGLRERIRQLQAAPRQHRAVLRTGVVPFDGLFPGGGVPLASGLELWGEAASGRTSLALRTVAAAHREQRLCAWVDGPQELYPPAAAALGVDLSRLLVVRPKEGRQLAWAAQQLCRSGAFACVVLDLTRTGVHLGLAEGKKLADAAFRGGSSLLLLTPPEAPSEGVIRLATSSVGVQGVSVEVLRNRQGGGGRRALIPWGALYPAGAPVYRYQAPSGHRPPEVHAGAHRPPYYRLKSNVERDGGGLYASRPGRDCPFPPLSAGWGVGA